MPKDALIPSLALKLAGIAILAVAYWQLVSTLTGAPEPWDARAYWTLAYPASVALSAIAGRFLGKRAWLAGIVVTFAQLPVMWLNNGSGPLWAVGLLFLMMLAIPCALVSALAGRFRR